MLVNASTLIASSFYFGENKALQVNFLISNFGKYSYMNMQIDTSQSETQQPLLGHSMLMACYARECIYFDRF
jgi:hypothetical protein